MTDGEYKTLACLFVLGGFVVVVDQIIKLL
jgi:hypothetical protein